MCLSCTFLPEVWDKTWRRSHFQQVKATTPRKSSRKLQHAAMKDKVRRGGGRNQAKTGEKSLQWVLFFCSSLCLCLSFTIFLTSSSLLSGASPARECEEGGRFSTPLLLWIWLILCFQQLFDHLVYCTLWICSDTTDINLKVGSDHDNKQPILTVHPESHILPIFFFLISAHLSPSECLSSVPLLFQDKMNKLMMRLC